MVDAIYNPFTFNHYGFYMDDEDPDRLIAIALWQKEHGFDDETKAPE